MILGDILTGALLILTACGQTEPATAGGAAPTPPYSEALLRQVPRSDKDADDRLALAQTRMATLQQLLSAPPPEASDEVATAIRSL